MDRAALWIDQGRREEALNLLASIYAWFTEGFETHDLKKAKALARPAAVIRPGQQISGSDTARSSGYFTSAWRH